MILRTGLTNPSVLVTRMAAIEKRSAPSLKVVGDDVPSVDLLITCCNEGGDVILNTVRAACALDWPVDRLRVLLLDDGRSRALSDAVTKLRGKHPNVFYTSRPKPLVPDYKAGNLNHDLKFSTTLPGGAAEFVAGLDADMIARPDWLRVALPHLLSDSQMGMVCFPQVCLNVRERSRYSGKLTPVRNSTISLCLIRLTMTLGAHTT